MPAAAQKSAGRDQGWLTQATLGHKPAAQGQAGPCLLLAPTNTLVLVSVLLQDERDQKANPAGK